ncbi:alpha/beta hydrolase [Nocardia bhagyanarayanae]|uniref:S-formylglutathione hydrolase FrmB n=1 Tax=Nocardia bhagyanarayanae TaxID=1215925 RepID=A0A543FBF1_9NOCA|nr:alpha/beta hydrolase family protein [Nocardia bhagyanarayanae]TQM31133.1 S-formylglutathione hydrolase FrmB [Nocardia bhagyanarayanae]
MRVGRVAAPVLVVVLALSFGAAARAEPSDWAAAPAPIDTTGSAMDPARLVSIAPGQGRALELVVHSPAMDRDLDLTVLPARDRAWPAPVLYLLNGVDGGAGGSWTGNTDIDRFFADRQVTVVVPRGGAGTYFTDWRADDPVLGRQRWTTFLTRELPPLIDTAFLGTGANAIAGVSMAGTSVFQLALAAPGRYRAIGSFSGCARTSDPQGRAVVSAIVAAHRGDPANMWGPPGDAAWADNDPYLHADRLRGTTVYVSTGTGLPGPLDTLDGPGIGASAAKLTDQLAIGGVLEAITSRCTEQLRDRLRDLGIPATFEHRATGTHSWGYWQRDLHTAWPVLAAALNG